MSRSPIVFLGPSVAPHTQRMAEGWLKRRGVTLPPEAWSGDPLRGDVLVPLGKWATSTVLPDAKGEFEKIRGYVDSAQGQWVVPTFHPGELQAGKRRYTGVWIHDVERAVRLAECGFQPHSPDYLLDPGAEAAARWADAYEAALLADAEGVWLAYDIETPYKVAGGDEGKVDYEDPSYTLLRIGFAYREGEALSVPWTQDYLPTIRRLLASRGVKLVWNGAYDNPRLRKAGFPPGGPLWDIMWGWHVLNSAIDKGLAFVATFYCPDQPRWKHLSQGTDSPRYNATDAEVTWRIAQGVVRDLKLHRQWALFERHVVQLEVPLLAMTTAGMPLDDAERRQFSEELAGLSSGLQAGMEAVVPLGARRYKDLTRPPKATDQRGFSLVEEQVETPFCSVCGMRSPPKAHARPWKKKQLNFCQDAGVDYSLAPVTRYRRYEPFTPSLTQLTAYQRATGHDPVLTRDRDKRITFDEDALKTLQRRYPQDPLYPQVLEYRAVDKLLGTYVGRWESDHHTGIGRWVGGMPVDRDGRVRTTYTHNPSTLRLSSQSPNLQNIPRAGKEDLAARVKGLFIAEGGYDLLEVDYAAIEAVLVGYFAGSASYLRLARLGVHDYLNGHILFGQGKTREVPDLSWEDADLKACFKDLKGRFPLERDTAKKIVHLSNYGGTPQKIQALHPELFRTVAQATVLQNLYFSVCPEIRVWQHQTIQLADKQGFLRNPFDYVHRFWRVQDWTKREGEWFASWGEDAKAALAFFPQSTAAAIIKEAILRLWYERPTEVGRSLRLQVHDSLVAMIVKDRWDAVAPVIWETMREPIPQLPLPPEWGMGESLVIDVEAKRGEAWRGMRAA